MGAYGVYPPSQKTTGMPLDESERLTSFVSGISARMLRGQMIS